MQPPVLTPDQRALRLSARWRQGLGEQIALLSRHGFLLSPAASDLEAPLACQLHNGVVIVAVGQSLATLRLLFEAFDKLLKLLNLVEEANQIFFSHGTGRLCVR